MRIIILTQYYPPETGAPQNRLSDLARRLIREGHQVWVLTAMPNYPSGAVLAEWKGRLISSDSIDGVSVLRSWIRASPSKRTGDQLLMYLSFVLSVTVSAPFRIRRADVLLWESPPLFLGPTAVFLAKRLGARLVTNVSDLWPQSAIELGVLRSSMVIAALRRLERWLYRRSALVTHQTDHIGAAIRSTAPGSHTYLWPNGVDNTLVDGGPTDPSGASDVLQRKSGQFLVGYVGNFGRAQALEQLISAAKHFAGDPNIRFVLIGGGTCRKEIEDSAVGLENVEIFGPVATAIAQRCARDLDLAIVPLADIPLLAGARPSKMFELMALGVPFVYCGTGEGATIARGSSVATVVPAEQPEDLAKAITYWRTMPLTERTQRITEGQAYVRERYDRAIVAHALSQALEALAVGATGPSS